MRVSIEDHKNISSNVIAGTNRIIFLPRAISISLIILCTNPFTLRSQQAQDCFNAITVCTNTYQQNISSTGPGTIQEIQQNSTCVANGETNSTWYVFKIHTGGSFLFQVNPLNMQDDYDYILYNLTGHNCTDIGSNLIQPLRCNYSSDAGSTGLSLNVSNASSGASGSNQCSSIIAIENETYALMINNFTATSSGYMLNFGGTAVIYDTQPPVFGSALASECNPVKAGLNFSEKIKCSSIAADGSDFSITGPSVVTVISAEGSECNTTMLASSVRIYFASPITVHGTYTVHLRQGNDGTTISDFCDNMIPVGATATFTVLYDAPSAAIVSQTIETCSALGTATGYASGGTSPYTYAWNTTPVQTTATALNLQAGNYILKATDANGCNAIATAHIVSAGLPVLTFTKFDVRCDSLFSGEATVHVQGGQAPYTYQWNTIPVQTTATATGLTAGNYMVTVTTADGCIVHQSISIPFIGLPVVTITQTNVSCDGLTLGSVAATAVGLAPFTYQWNTTPVQYTPQLSALSVGSYIVTVTDAAGCFVETPVSIINGGMVLVPASVALSCASVHSGQASVMASDGTFPYSYEWNTSPPQYTETALLLSGGLYTVVVKDAGGCVDSANIIVEAPAIIAVNINPHSADCDMNNGSATAIVTGGYPPYLYNWGTLPAQSDSIAVNLEGGIYPLTITDSVGCIGIESAYIADLNGPEGFITDVVDATCDRANGSAAVTGVTGNSPFTYLWNTTVPQFGSLATGLGQNTYFVMIADSGGCLSFLHVKINSTEMGTLSFVSTTNASCSGFDGSAVVTASGGSSPYQYLWNTIPAQISAAAHGLGGGNHIVTLTDGNGCIDTMTINISEGKAINNFIFSNACLDSPVIFEAQSSYTGSAIWAWDFGDSTYSSGMSPSAEHIFQSTGNYPVTLYVNGGCATDTLYKIVKGANKPRAAFIQESLSAYVSAPVQFEYSGSEVSLYAWDFGDGVFSSSGSPIHLFEVAEDSALITLYVTDEFGCLDTAIKKLFVDKPPSVFLPNSFTPNGDGLNDEFKISTGDISDCSLQIFNRWGELVFASANVLQLQNEGWNGNVKGLPAGVGSYPYILTAKLADGTTLYRNGNISLLK